jgi:hypothetical protein
MGDFSAAGRAKKTTVRRNKDSEPCRDMEYEESPRARVVIDRNQADCSRCRSSNQSEFNRCQDGVRDTRERRIPSRKRIAEPKAGKQLRSRNPGNNKWALVYSKTLWVRACRKLKKLTVGSLTVLRQGSSCERLGFREFQFG